VNCPRCRHPGFHPDSMCDPPDGTSYDDPVCLGCYEELSRSRFRDARDRERRTEEGRQ